MFGIIGKYITGFSKVKVSGQYIERFINLCKARNLMLWGIEKNNEGCIFFISSNDVTALDVPAKKTDSEISILKEYGVKYFIRGHKRKLPVAVIMLVFMIIVYVQSLFIWNIKVEGESDLTKDEVLKRITDFYVPIGTKISEIDCDELEKQLRKDFDDIAWISCSITGTILKVDITETLNVYTDIKSDTPCNIVAVKPCTVSSIITSYGTPVVTAGSEVEKGDVLISGAIYLYDDNNEVLDTNYVAAEGEVWGICEQDYYQETKLSYYKKNFSGKSSSYYTFGILGYELTPYVPEISYDNYDIMTTENRLHIGKAFYLPVYIEKTSINEYEFENESMSEEEALEKAKTKLQQYIYDLQEKGVQIIENNVKISIVGEKCVAEGTIKTCELVGIPQELEVIREEEDIE